MHIRFLRKPNSINVRKVLCRQSFVESVEEITGGFLVRRGGLG